MEEVRSWDDVMQRWHLVNFPDELIQEVLKAKEDFRVDLSARVEQKVDSTKSKFSYILFVKQNQELSDCPCLHKVLMARCWKPWNAAYSNSCCCMGRSRERQRSGMSAYPYFSQPQ